MFTNNERAQKRNTIAQLQVMKNANLARAEHLKKNGDAFDKSVLVGENSELAELQAAKIDLLKRELDDDATGAMDDDALVDFSRGAKASKYVQAAISGRRLDGLEAELNEEIYGDSDVSGTGGIRVPWAALAPRGIRNADVATSAPAAQGDQREQAFINRVFSSSAASFLGVAMPMAPGGTSEYSVLSAGSNPSQLAPGGLKEAEAATITATTLKPTRLAARYIFRKEDEAKSPNFLEMGLRTDLSRALSDAADNLVLNGTGTAPQPTGFLAGIAASSDPSAETTYAGYISDFAQIDGRHSRNLMDICAVCAPDLYSHAIGKFRANEDSDTAMLWAERNLGGVLTCANLPAASNASISKMVLYRKNKQGAYADAVMPMWGSPELIRDQYTRAGRGEIAITMNLLWGFSILRTGAYAVRSVKIGS